MSYQFFNLNKLEFFFKKIRYLYFDIPRAIQVIGGSALAYANVSTPGTTLLDYSQPGKGVAFCLYGNGTPAVAKLQVEKINLK